MNTLVSKIKQLLKVSTLAMIIALGIFSFQQAIPQNAHADSLDIDAVNERLGADTGTANEEAGSKESCGGVTVAFKVGCKEDFSNPILAYLVALLRFLSYGVGIIVILMIVIGGIQYAAAGDNAQSVSAAKKRIVNAFTALLLYIFAFAILNFVVPGGLIG